MTGSTLIVLAILVAGPLVPAPGRLQVAAPREEAAAAFAEGEQAFRRGAYADAVAHFSHAQRLVPHPHTLYNLGLAQQQAGDLPAAWESFRRLEHGAASAVERDDARARLNRIERKVAVLRVQARPRQRLCLDARPIPRHGPGTFELAAREGSYALVLDGHRVDVGLVEGETRVLALDGAQDLWDGPRTHRAVPVLAGVTVGAAAAAAGLGAAAVAVQSPQPATARGLGIGATSAAALTTATGVAALVLHLRARRSGPARASAREGTSDECPPHPDLE